MLPNLITTTKQPDRSAVGALEWGCWCSQELRLSMKQKTSVPPQLRQKDEISQLLLFITINHITSLPYYKIKTTEYQHIKNIEKKYKFKNNLYTFLSHFGLLSTSTVARQTLFPPPYPMATSPHGQAPAACSSLHHCPQPPPWLHHANGTPACTS